jgi:hypothetical protein
VSSFQKKSITTFFLLKKQWYSFAPSLMEYIRIRCKYKFNIAKNKNDESANKLTTFKLTTYNGKMSTNNMIKLKSPECSCFRICNYGAKIIYGIYNWLKLIFQYELNEYRNKTGNQTQYQWRRTIQCRTHTTKSQQMKETKRLNLCENHLFRSKARKKKMLRGDFRPKWPKITPHRWRKKKTRREKN